MRVIDLTYGKTEFIVMFYIAKFRLWRMHQQSLFEWRNLRERQRDI